MRTPAFAIGLLIGAVGAAGIIAPSGLAWIAEHFVSSGAFVIIATVRVAFGLVLISVASVSRAPKTIRALGYLIVIAGITTGLMGLAAIERARAVIDWWLQQGSGVVRLTGVVVLTLGGFVAWACSARRAA